MTARTSAARQQAVSRSLDNARTRAEHRVQRYLDATTELVVEHNGQDFTVQQVVERAQQSLRSFYQSFDGKQHLLLAVYEEAMAASAANLRAVVGEQADPAARLDCFVTTLFEWCEREPETELPDAHRTVRAMASFVFELLATDPRAVAAAHAPLFDLLVELVTDAQHAGLVRAGNVRRMAATALQSTMFCAFATATPIDRDDAVPAATRAEEMREFVLGGLRPR